MTIAVDMGRKATKTNKQTKCRSLDLSVLERQGQLKVNNISNRKKVMLTKDVHLSSHLADYVL